MQQPSRTTALAAIAIAIAASAVVAVLVWPRLSRRSAPVPRSEHYEAVERGRSYLRAGRPDLAFEVVSSIRDEQPGAGEAMTIAGMALLQFKQFAGARLAFERALKLQPDQLDAIKALATLNLGLGNGVRGRELLEAATRLDPKDPQIWLMMGRVSNDLGDPAEAVEAFEGALKLDPNDREALGGLIGGLLEINQGDRAAPWIAQALKSAPDDPVILGLAARQAHDASRDDEAITFASRALERDPDNINALLVRARSRVASGRLDLALADLEHAVAIKPNDLGSLQLLSQVEGRLGLAERARQTGRRLRRGSERAVEMVGITQEISRNPDDPELRCRLGRLAAEGGSTYLAIQCYRAALALDPKYQPAEDGLAALRPPTPGESIPDRAKGQADPAQASP